MDVSVYILNYNGLELLPQCLPSIVREAERSEFRCRVVVIDNESTDAGLAWLAKSHPEVYVRLQSNRGLCSFNKVLAEDTASVALLLNNDIRLSEGAIDALVEPLLRQDAASPDYFMTAPLCYQFDGETYEGFLTAVDWRYGLIRATAMFPGCERRIDRRQLTASVGAAMAVDREKFLRLGGFDPIYLPGRIEDLDLAFRAYLAGWPILYVPDARVEHLGMATFGKVFGQAGCDHLALRNTLLFQWKNLRTFRHRTRAALGLGIRLLADFVRAPLVVRERRFAMIRAFREALLIWRTREREERGESVGGSAQREREFFQRFHPKRMLAEPN